MYLFSIKASAHWYKLPFYYDAILNISLFLCAPITSDECHAWFHFNAACAAAMNMEQAKITKWKTFVQSRIRTLARHGIQLISPPP